MFFKLSALALLAPLVAGTITLSNPPNPTSGGTVTITWTADQTDPVFTLELINVAFNSQFAIANNVNPTAGTITLTLPVVPIGDGYTLQAVNIGNINQIYSETSDFSVGASSTTSSSSSSSTTTVSGSGSVTVTKSGSAASTTPSITTTTNGFGTTLSAPPPSSTGTGSGSSSSTSSGASPSTSNFNSAVPVKFGFSTAGSFAVLLLGAVAGAAVVAL